MNNEQGWRLGLGRINAACTAETSYPQLVHFDLPHANASSPEYVIVCPAYLWRTARDPKTKALTLLENGDPFAVTLGHERAHFIDAAHTIDGSYVRMRACYQEYWGKSREWEIAQAPAIPSHDYVVHIDPLTELVPDHFSYEALASALSGKSAEEQLKLIRQNAAQSCDKPGGGGYLPGPSRIQIMAQNPSLRKVLGCRKAPRNLRPYCSPAGPVW
jgi:hypothetical protein